MPDSDDWLDADAVARRLTVPREHLPALVMINRIPRPTYQFDSVTPYWDTRALDTAVASWSSRHGGSGVAGTTQGVGDRSGDGEAGE